MALGVAILGGVAGASSTTSEGIVTLTPAHTLASGTSIAAGKSLALVVSGGSTTVPTDATRVQFSVTVEKQQKVGTLTAQPYLDAADASGDSLAWAAPNAVVTATFLEPVGVSNKVNFTNSSAGSVAVLIKITGYSTSARLAARLDTVENNQATDETAIAQQGNSITSLTNRVQGDEQKQHRGWTSSAAGVSLTAGENYLMVTTPFTAPDNLTCVVTSSVQILTSTAPAAGSGVVYMRNAMKLDANAPANDGFFGHYLSSAGTPGFQPDITRSSTFFVAGGHSVQFGAYLGNVSGAYVGAQAFFSTSFDCG